ncbi:phage tail protein [Escherichia coli]|uniref:phage tail-collar fiber domain-containing protein n=1 Tax=Escherichia coli TaxID=562 RepID=UPI003458AD03
MASEFFTILTAAGKAKIASALAEQKQIRLQTMVVGDGNGKYIEPTESQTKVVHEVWRGQLNTLKIAPDNPAWVIAEAIIPEQVGGWYVREVGLLDTDGTMVAIGKFPETYKPRLPAGASKQIVIRAVMEVTNADAVTLLIDPSVVVATREYVDDALKTHQQSRNHPDATLTQKGFTQLSNATNSDDETKAATPKAVKTAYDLANSKAATSHNHAWNQITGIPDGTLTQKGVVKLNNTTNSTSTTEAATPSAVKAAMDKAIAAAPSSHTHAWGQITGIPDGTLTQKGVVKLNNATNSTSTTEAATPNAVKAAMDKAIAAESCPVGMPIPWPSDSVPSGYALMTGQTFNHGIKTTNTAGAHSHDSGSGESSEGGKPRYGTRDNTTNNFGSGESDHDNYKFNTSTDGEHAHSVNVGSHSHSVILGSHNHSIALGSHNHSLTINNTGNTENTVKNIAFNYIVRLA